MQRLKGRSSNKLQAEFGELRRQFWGRHLWARGYFAASSGNVTDEVIAEYIRLQDEQPKLCCERRRRSPWAADKSLRPARGSALVTGRDGSHRR
jgi:hypothetical protein